MITLNTSVVAFDLTAGDIYTYPGQSAFRRIITEPVLTEAENVEFRVQDLGSGHTYSVSLDPRFRVEVANSIPKVA